MVYIPSADSLMV